MPRQGCPGFEPGTPRLPTCGLRQSVKQVPPLSPYCGWLSRPQVRCLSCRLSVEGLRLPKTHTHPHHRGFLDTRNPLPPAKGACAPQLPCLYPLQGLSVLLGREGDAVNNPDGRGRSFVLDQDIHPFE